MNKFTPLSEIDPAVCSLPIPEYVDYDNIGVNLDRLMGITALGCFASDKVRITSADGERDKEIVGIAGTSGGAAFAVPAASAAASKIARHDTSQDIDNLLGLHQSRMPASLLVTLNSVAIADKVSNSRSPLEWAAQTDKALRHELGRAVMHNLVKSAPTSREIGMGLIITVLGVGNLPGWFATSPVFAGASMAWYELCANIGAVGQVVRNKARLSEARLSLVPCFHVDRLALAALRLKTTKLIKPINT